MNMNGNESLNTDIKNLQYMAEVLKLITFLHH